MQWIQHSLILVREGAGYGFSFEDLPEFRDWVERENGFSRLELRRNDAARCWEDDHGPVLVDGVEFVEIDELADLTDVEEVVRAEVSPLVPVAWSVVPVYAPNGELVERVKVR